MCLGSGYSQRPGTESVGLKLAQPTAGLKVCVHQTTGSADLINESARLEIIMEVDGTTLKWTISLPLS